MKKVKSQIIKEIVNKLPDAPGVYRFMRGSDILYIGKATSLHDRVRSYFNADIVSTRSPLISKMLSEFDHIEYTETGSVLEALVLEAHLIKKYQPEANIKEKDNRSFNYVVITDEAFPRVLVMRGRELEKFFLGASLEGYAVRSADRPLSLAPSRSEAPSRDDTSTNFSPAHVAYTFGPFPNGSQLKEAMKIVRKMFPFRDTCIPAAEQVNKKLRPCFNRQIGLCPGVCTGEISEKDYKETIKNIIYFFESDRKKLIKNLEKQMKGYAKLREFEKAEQVKKTLFTLDHIQDIALIKEEKVNASDRFRIESYDIAHMAGTDVVGVMTVVEGGEAVPASYRKFKIKDNPGINDTRALSEVLSRRLAHIEWPLPDLIVVDGGVAQKNAIEKVLRDVSVRIPVVSVVKDDRHKPKEILGDKKYLVHESGILLSNSEAHRYAIGYHTQLRNKRMRG